MPFLGHFLHNRLYPLLDTITDGDTVRIEVANDEGLTFETVQPAGWALELRRRPPSDWEAAAFCIELY